MMYLLGFNYFPRWVVDYLDLPQWSTPQLILTGAAYLIGLGFMVFVFNIMRSSTRGVAVSGDPWAIGDSDNAKAGSAKPVPAE